MTDLKNALVRAVRTYLQTFTGLVIVAWSDTIDLSTLRALAVAAVPAALSALQNFLETTTPVEVPRG